MILYDHFPSKLRFETYQRQHAVVHNEKRKGGGFWTPYPPLFFLDSTRKAMSFIHVVIPFYLENISTSNSERDQEKIILQAPFCEDIT